MTQPEPAPLFTPPQATALLDQVIYEQVLECVDLDALYHLEQSLLLMVSDLQAMPHDRATETTQALLDRCLLRLPDDVRRFLSTGPVSMPFAFDDCALCDNLERDHAPSVDIGPNARPRPRPKPGPRHKA